MPELEESPPELDDELELLDDELELLDDELLLELESDPELDDPEPEELLLEELEPELDDELLLELDELESEELLSGSSEDESGSSGSSLPDESSLQLPVG